MALDDYFRQPDLATGNNSITDEDTYMPTFRPLYRGVSVCAGCLTSHGISGDLANMVEGVQSFSWLDIDIVCGGLSGSRVH